ncbi:MAG: ferredoxin [bacterium]|nr:ferredoxin [bacterium]
MALRVDNNKCIGCNLCASIAPDAFKLNDINHRSEVIKGAQITDSVKEAIQVCPVEAIGEN